MSLFAVSLLAGGSRLAHAVMTAKPAAPPGPGAPKPVPAIAWGTQRDKATAAARRDGKPLLVYVWAAWCGPCRDMEASLWSRKDVIEMAGKFVWLKVDVDKDPSTAQKYMVDSLPTVSIADPWGAVLTRRVGYTVPEPFIDWMRQAPTDFKEVAPWQERLAANPRDVEALRHVGQVYQHLGFYDASTEALSKVLQSKEAKAKPALLAETLTLIGWNQLRAHDLGPARKSFERCLKEVPTHPKLDVTLYGLLAVNLASGQSDKAGTFLARMESCCPNSPFTARARNDMEHPPEPEP